MLGQQTRLEGLSNMSPFPQGLNKQLWDYTFYEYFLRVLCLRLSLTFTFKSHLIIIQYIAFYRMQ